MPGTENGSENPFVERPDEYKVVGDELYCWMPGSDQRECNGACVAFEERATDPESGLDMCKVLNSIRNISGSLAMMMKADRIKQRQEVIRRQPQPPEVR